MEPPSRCDFERRAGQAVVDLQVWSLYRSRPAVRTRRSAVTEHSQHWKVCSALRKQHPLYLKQNPGLDERDHFLCLGSWASQSIRRIPLRFRVRQGKKLLEDFLSKRVSRIVSEEKFGRDVSKNRRFDFRPTF